MEKLKGLMKDFRKYTAGLPREKSPQMLFETQNRSYVAPEDSLSQVS